MVNGRPTWSVPRLPAAILSVFVFSAFGLTAHAQQGAQVFAGEWRPLPDARGSGPARTPRALASVRISQDRTGWVVQAFGVCQPTPCDWGSVPFTFLESRPPGSSVGYATFHIRTSTRVMTFKLGEDSLVVEMYNFFSGPKDQPSYYVVEELVSTKPPTARAPKKK
jgi:hypothetical protein